MVDDTTRYYKYQRQIEEGYESICERCGKCCGADDGDPCKHLEKLPDGTYRCKIYSHRLGEQETVSGKKFRCVPIREILKYEDVIPDCAYRKLRKGYF